MSDISQNTTAVLARVASSAVAAGKEPSEITVIAASKMNEALRVREAFAAGIEVFGENRVQEMLEKNRQGAYSGASLHFIGRLQRNKVRQVVGVAELIHSADSLPLIAEIDRCAGKASLVQDILIEINIAGEESKGGFSSAETASVLDAVSSFKNVRVRGLMAIPPICSNPADNVPFFESMTQLFVDNSLKKYDNISMDFLSMGMSGDFEAAIACGANMVRIGSAIFGPRNYNI
ncbi:MAG: YggS family pyridoxal phosphate-dependent enzyme [Oscillospiraceae bacterium]|nr:YggS family pyridoxal phosphate-dependent enzyme [Oscillospiraceae bacterium]